MRREVRLMRASINTVVVVLVAALVAMLGMCVPVVCAEQPQWKFSGDSLFKIYWQSTLRIANETDLSAGGMLGPLRLEAVYASPGPIGAYLPMR